MKRLLKFSFMALITSVVVISPTSCSKEQSSEQISKGVRKSAPVALDRDHDDVLEFKTQYDEYADGNSYAYNTLTMDDAQWILEAAFNYDHRVLDLSEIDDFGVTYVDKDDITLTVGDYQGGVTVTSAELFSAYSDLLDQVDSVSIMAPMSDFEIEPITSISAKIHVRQANRAAPINLFLQYTTPIAYDDYHRSWETSSNIKSNHWVQNAPYCGTGNVSGIWSWEALMVNLRATKTIFILQSTGSSPYWHTVVPHKYGDDPFADVVNANSYTGPASQDYSLDIYGAHPVLVNSSSFADGHWAQCISEGQMDDFEYNMADILDDHTTVTNSGITSLKLYAQAASYTGGSPAANNWTHHVFEFTTGIKNP